MQQWYWLEGINLLWANCRVADSFKFYQKTVYEIHIVKQSLDYPLSILLVYDFILAFPILRELRNIVLYRDNFYSHVPSTLGLGD